VEPSKKYWQFLEYLFIFPQIIAGPIVKYNDLALQITQRKFSHTDFIAGFKRFAIGIFKKVWIADVLAKYADLAFNGPSNVIPIHYTWLGLLCYAFQIYFDFSSYSDMAIGLLKIMGFNIPENFNFPYISKSISEFWKRWHISLTSWMREYLYIPLGGNRKGVLRTYANQWIVFLISGLWHGANWNFVFWGIYHGSLLCIEKAALKHLKKIPGLIRMAFTFFLVCIGWVFFRADGFAAGSDYLKQMFNISSVKIHTPPGRIMVIDNRGIIIFIIACIICFVPVFDKKYLNSRGLVHPKLKLVFCFLLFLLSALKIGTASISPFIYFRF
jgi:alginate O-acetyltransferase complex protein AlgI